MDIERYYSTNTVLFSGAGNIDEHLRDFLGRLEREISVWDEDALLQAPDSEILSYLTGKYSIECPVLDLEGRRLLPAREVVLPSVLRAPDHPMRDVKRKRFVLLVPFTGVIDILRMKPNTVDAEPPRAHLDGSRFSLVVDGVEDPTAIRAEFDRQIEIIDRYLQQLRAEIDKYRLQLEQVITSAVSGRRRDILALREQEASIGFPVIRTVDSATFTFPVARRQITRPAARTNTPFAPEPTLAQEDYEAALHVIANARNGFERSPSTTAKLDEEEIRDLLLVILNGHFQGAAGGELFNGQGKTDILIRVEDRNIFIGECKFWAGPSMISTTLDQLLSYMVWRDTKAALLLFIRNKDVTTAIHKAVEAVKAHGQFKRTLNSANGERYDFVFGSTSDPEREIRLALIPFHIRR